MNKKRAALILGSVCFVLVIAICIQIKTVKKMTEDVGFSLRENRELKDEYLKWKSEYDSKYAELEKLENELEKVRNEAISDNESDTKREKEIKENNKLLGLTALNGSGLVFVINDNRNGNVDGNVDISSSLIHEEDILNIVNELFNAGAEAVSINDQRIVQATAIACDGNIVRINHEKIGAPFTIRAIGYPESLYYAINRQGGWLSIMKDDGIEVSYMEKEYNVNVPKYSGLYSYDYIER